MGKNKQTIEGAMFLPGIIYNGGADLSAPLLPLASIQHMLSMYNFSELEQAIPLMDAFGTYAAEYGVIDYGLKHLYTSVILFHRHKKEMLVQMLSVIVIKYGWFDIPDDLMIRAEQYLIKYAEVLSWVQEIKYRHEHGMENAEHGLMLRVSKYTHKNTWEHMRYIASALYYKLQHTPRMTVTQMLNQGERGDYTFTAAELVKISLVLSKCNVKVPLNQNFVNSPLFKAALTMMPDYVIGPRMVYKNPIAALEKTWGCKLPIVDVAAVKLLKPQSTGRGPMCLLTMDPIIQPTFAVEPLEGIGPRLMDFTERFNTHTDKEGGLWSHVWYIGGISTWPGIADDEKVCTYVAKILCSWWRMDEMRFGIDTNRLFGHIAQMFKLNTDDILGVYYRLSMSNIEWAYTRMPVLVKAGVAIGPRIENVTSKAIIRKSQTGVSACVREIAKLVVEGIPKQEDEDEEFETT